MPVAEIIGYIAGLVIVTSWIPQVVKTYKTKSVNDLSIIMLALILSGTALWIIYGFLVKDMPIIAVNAVLIAIISSLLFLKLRYEK